jgi:hypothetical protein
VAVRVIRVAVFWIRDVLIWIWITHHWITDPDPALFFTGFQDVNK